MQTISFIHEATVLYIVLLAAYPCLNYLCVFFSRHYFLSSIPRWECYFWTHTFLKRVITLIWVNGLRVRPIHISTISHDFSAYNDQIFMYLFLYSIYGFQLLCWCYYWNMLAIEAVPLKKACDILWHTQADMVFLDGMFQANSTHHIYNTRNRNQLHTPKHRLVKTEHSIRFLRQQIWNVIPDHTKQSNTLPMFKAKLKTILIQNG